MVFYSFFFCIFFFCFFLSISLLSFLFISTHSTEELRKFVWSHCEINFDWILFSWTTMCVHVHIFFLLLLRRLYFARNVSSLVAPFTRSPRHLDGCIRFARSGIRGCACGFVCLRACVYQNAHEYHIREATLHCASSCRLASIHAIRMRVSVSGVRFNVPLPVCVCVCMNLRANVTHTNIRFMFSLLDCCVRVCEFMDSTSWIHVTLPLEQAEREKKHNKHTHTNTIDHDIILYRCYYCSYDYYRCCCRCRRHVIVLFWFLLRAEKEAEGERVRARVTRNKNTNNNNNNVLWLNVSRAQRIPHKSHTLRQWEEERHRRDTRDIVTNVHRCLRVCAHMHVLVLKHFHSVYKTYHLRFCVEF